MNINNWQGAPAAVAAAIVGYKDVLGPVTVAGVAYVRVVTTAPISPPAGLTEAPIETAAVHCGVLMGEQIYLPPVE